VGPRAGLDDVEIPYRESNPGRPAHHYTVSYILLNVYRIEMRNVNMKYIESITIYNGV
jgi:hypothetical protein